MIIKWTVVLLCPDIGSGMEMFGWSGRAKSALRAVKKAQQAAFVVNYLDIPAENFALLFCVAGDQKWWGYHDDVPDTSPSKQDVAIYRAIEAFKKGKKT